MSGLAIHNIFELRPLPRHQRYFKSDWIQSIESNKQIDFSAVNELELHAMPHSGNSIVFHIMKQKALKVKKRENIAKTHKKKNKTKKSSPIEILLMRPTCSNVFTYNFSLKSLSPNTAILTVVTVFVTSTSISDRAFLCVCQYGRIYFAFAFALVPKFVVRFFFLFDKKNFQLNRKPLTSSRW